ncbi:MAG: NAD(P)/FAD-dependent oxidoreductase [Pseudomonadota bacterium]
MSNTSQTFDFVIVGSGINSLVCAARLAIAGHKVAVIERNDRLGGCIRTDELTLPGFKHDTLSGFHPLFVSSPTYSELNNELSNAGLKYCNTPYPTGVILDDGRSLVLETNRQANIERFNSVAAGDGDAYARALASVEKDAELTFSLLGGAVWSFPTLKVLGKTFVSRGIGGLTDYFGSAIGNCRTWLEGDFNSELVRALFAPWVLHAGLGPDASMSGLMGRVMAFSLEQLGMPIVQGGSSHFVAAFEAIITSHGGEIFKGTHIDEIEVANNVAQSAVASSGLRYIGRKGIICNVAPTQLYLHLLRNASLDSGIIEQIRNYRYGRGDMQIHLALKEPLAWPDPILQKVAMLHITPGLDGVSRAVNEADCGMLPGTATIVAAQPTALDPMRAPNGKHILWIQLQELPRKIKGDAAGEITIGSDGVWTPNIRDAYVQRILQRLEKLAPNLRNALLDVKALSPTDIEKLNINLVGGDPYCGVCSLDQFMLWRPYKGVRNHRTPIKNLTHIGASTHPGPGLGGGSGFLASESLK